MAELLDLTLDPVIAPERVLERQPDDKPAEQVDHRRPARPSPITEVMLGRNQLSVPPQDRVWRDDRRPLAKQFATQLFAEHRQSTALVIVQPRTLAQLLAKNSILLPLVLKPGTGVAGPRGLTASQTWQLCRVGAVP